MDIKEIRELIQAVCESGIAELELERTGVKVRIRKDNPLSQSVQVETNSSDESLPVQLIDQSTAQSLEKTSSISNSDESDLHIIRSPIVGTFYQSSKPNAKPFVQIGDQVEAGSVLCIIEAMKLMNEIEADARGEITEIYVKNNDSVEFGQALFGIRRDG
ncbi:MAG: acetyl-CoA carboxylase biotin carboxyl carrier protein [Acidobacteriia bacterium]|nr:acetyl-CoA carboxylase biotin carboxyl carrier protein [Terriglobia bacterium]